MIEKLCNWKINGLPKEYFKNKYFEHLKTLLDKAPNLEHLCINRDYNEIIKVSTIHKLHKLKCIYL